MTRVHHSNRGPKEIHKENVILLWPFFMLFSIANPSMFICPIKMTGAIIYCTLYCIKYVTDITVHLYINILFNMLYMCIQQTQTVQCRQTRCIYVCKISGTYQQFLIDIAYYMQFINAILSPCNRWDNIRNKRLKTEVPVTKGAINGSPFNKSEE